MFSSDLTLFNILMKSSNNSLCLQDILLSFSKAIDLMHPELNEHHNRVAYIAYKIANAMGYDKDHLQNIVMAALLHDVGSFSERERMNLLVFEDQNYSQIDIHAEIGYRLLRDFAPLSTVASYIRFHHKPWQLTKANEHLDIPLESHIIHLADRIAVLIHKNENILQQVNHIKQRVVAYSNVLSPRLIEIFTELASKESFWLDVVYEPIDKTFCNELNIIFIPFCMVQLESIVKLFRRIIDFRSRFTATHSCGVAAVASVIAKIAGFNTEDVYTMKLAGYLHDLGKIAIPTEILEKPSELTPQEIYVMRTHPYHTNRILRPLPFLDTIRIWGSQHHERIDGNGYPFHIGNTDLALGSRIMMAGDIFTALTENRPYRKKSMLIPEVLNIMQTLVKTHILDAEVYDWLYNNVDDINEVRVAAQNDSELEYQNFLKA